MSNKYVYKLVKNTKNTKNKSFANCNNKLNIER